jgi:acetyl-CoA carboxylase biotin carboxyl carrier protein
MSYTLEDVRRVLKAFENSSWDEIHLTADGFELHVSAKTDAPPEPAPPAESSHESAEPETASEEPRVTAPEPDAPVVEAAPEDTSAIVAPSLGIFWRSPRPGAPPFADVGDEVDEDSTVCIVEVMKLMNQVKAGRRGRIVEVLADNGTTVEQGQPLFTVAER